MTQQNPKSPQNPPQNPGQKGNPEQGNPRQNPQPSTKPGEPGERGRPGDTGRKEERPGGKEKSQSLGDEGGGGPSEPDGPATNPTSRPSVSPSPPHYGDTEPGDPRHIETEA